MKSIDMIKTNRFSYKDLMEYFDISDYVKLNELINKLIGDNKIIPIKKYGKTSFAPSVYIEYKKVKAAKDYSEYEKEILGLHPQLNINKYLNNPEKYLDHREALEKLSDFLWIKSHSLKEDISVKERSFEIWGDEKLLESKQGRNICAFNGLDFKKLNCFYAPEPYFSKLFLDSDDKVTALVIENKDTWYSLGKALEKSQNRQLFGIKFNMLIFGEGNKVTRTNGLTDYLKDFSRGNIKLYYIGDIDRAGVGFLYGARSANPTLEIQPFIDLYKLMVSKVIVDNMIDTDDERNIEYNKEFLEYFTSEEAAIIQEILDKNKRIPQEILNYQDYLKIVY